MVVSYREVLPSLVFVPSLSWQMFDVKHYHYYLSQEKKDGCSPIGAVRGRFLVLGDGSDEVELGQSATPLGKVAARHRPRCLEQRRRHCMPKTAVFLERVFLCFVCPEAVLVKCSLPAFYRRDLKKKDR